MVYIFVIFLCFACVGLLKIVASWQSKFQRHGLSSDHGEIFFLKYHCWNCDTRPSKPWISNLKNHLTINQHILKIHQKTRWLIYKSSSHKLWISNLEDTILKPCSLESPDFSMNFHSTHILFGQGVPSKLKPPAQQPTGLHMSPWAASCTSWPTGFLCELLYLYPTFSSVVSMHKLIICWICYGLFKCLMIMIFYYKIKYINNTGYYPATNLQGW